MKVLLSEMPESSLNADAKYWLAEFVKQWVYGYNGVVYSPGGLAWAGEWGSLRYAGKARVS